MILATNLRHMKALKRNQTIYKACGINFKFEDIPRLPDGTPHLTVNLLFGYAKEPFVCPVVRWHEVFK